MKFGLVENARESLEHAVEHLTASANDPSPADLKHAILSVTHAVELVLKERLRRVHPAFVWQNVDKYPSPDAPTVDTGTAISRLLRMGNVGLREEAVNEIWRARNLRNHIQHFEFEMGPEEARANVGRVVAFLLDFARRHLGTDLVEDHDALPWCLLDGVVDFWVQHADLAADRLKEEVGEADVIDCPNCCWDTYSLSRRECTLCGYGGEPLKCTLCGVWTHYACDDGGVSICFDCLDKVVLRVHVAKNREDGGTQLVALELPGSEFLDLLASGREGLVVRVEVIRRADQPGLGPPTPP